jgi:hypothetical protein
MYNAQPALKADFTGNFPSTPAAAGKQTNKFDKLSLQWE